MGIGLSASQKILETTGIDCNTRVKDMTPDQVALIRDEISNSYKVEGALRSEVHMNIKRLMDIGCYRGLRHRRNLPCRGQRTHTNARTRRGKRSTSIKKKK